MQNLLIVTTVSLFAIACGGSYPVPQQKLADAEAAHRSAHELGAAQKTAAQLNLKLAEEGLATARAQIKNGENERAESTLLRAKADAELALALAREHDAKTETSKAIDTSKAAQDARTNGAK